MSSDETTKIEPTLIVKDAPPIAVSEPAETAKSEPETAKPEAQPPELKIETPAIAPVEAPKSEAPKFELPKSEAPTLPPAPQIDPVVVPLKRPKPASEPATSATRSTRFALLAASVAIAASFGAIGGSLGVAKFGPMISSAPTPVAPVAKEHVADEVKALKEQVAQLRASTKALSDNFAALKTTVASSGAQNGKIAESLERIEKAQAEQRKTASTAEVTGSIAQKQAPAVPQVLGAPPANLKPPVVPGYVLRRVYDGAALIEGRDGVIEVEPGMTAPGLGRIEAIRREDGRWVVVTARGLVVSR